MTPSTREVRETDAGVEISEGAEPGLRSDARDIEQQARAARSPEDGRNIL